MVYQSLVCWINCLTVSTCPDLLTVQQPLYLPPSFKIHHRAITPPLFTHFTAPFPHRHMAFIFNWMPMPSWNHSSVFHTPTINRLTPAPPPKETGKPSWKIGSQWDWDRTLWWSLLFLEILDMVNTELTATFTDYRYHESQLACHYLDLGHTPDVQCNHSSSTHKIVTTLLSIT